MRAFIIAVGVWLGAYAATEAHEARAPISLQGESMGMGGVGSLILNMRVQDARALGFAFEQGATDGDCSEWTVLPRHADGAVRLISDRGFITRISVTGDLAVRTFEGIAIGSSSADVMAAYPGAQSEGAEYFDPAAREIYVWRDTENWTGLHFVIDEHDQVSEIQVGGELRNIEGCGPSR